jgi:hypothetical protein
MVSGRPLAVLAELPAKQGERNERSARVRHSPATAQVSSHQSLLSSRFDDVGEVQVEVDLGVRTTGVTPHERTLCDCDSVIGM